MLFCQGDAGWLNQNKDALMAILRDFANPANVANPSNEHGDPDFTSMRNKDWFVGHSWAAGTN